MSICLCDGQPISDTAHAVAADDRGLSYGDGVFETMFLRDGQVRFLESHLQRLEASCKRLDIALVRQEVENDIATAAASATQGVLKVIVTRGSGGRGYRPDRAAKPRRIVTVHPLPAPDPEGGLTLRWCETRMSRNAALAGMKHLNRLEQVMAQGEWDDATIAEGLMLDTEGELVGATAGNIFVVRGGTLLTPDLRFCGVRGVMRSEVLRVAGKLGLACSEEPLWPHDLNDATELFVTNAVRGIRPVATLDAQSWTSRDVARQIAQVLQL